MAASEKLQSMIADGGELDGSPAPPTPPRQPSPVVEDFPVVKCIQKPSERVLDIIKGRGATSNRRSDPILGRGIQRPTLAKAEGDQMPELVRYIKDDLPEQAELEGEGQAAWRQTLPPSTQWWRR